MTDVKKVECSLVRAPQAASIWEFLGAINNYVSLQDEYDCVYCIVDVHARDHGGNNTGSEIKYF